MITILHLIKNKTDLSIINQTFDVALDNELPTFEKNPPPDEALCFI